MTDETGITDIPEVNFDTALKVLLGVPTKKEEVPVPAELHPDFSWLAPSK